MTAYVLAEVSIRDRPRYERYISGFMPVLKQFGGRLVALDDDPEVLEGEWRRDRVVILAFEDAEAAKRWARSPEYRAIAQDRIAATEVDVLLLKGV